MIRFTIRRAVWRRVFIALSCFLCYSSASVSAQEMELTLERVGHWGGCSTDIHIAGDRAYLAVGPRVVVLDVSSQGEPDYLGQSVALPNVIMTLDVEGDFVYAGTYEDGLHILDVSDPSHVLHVGSDTPGVECRGVAVADGYAYLGDYDGWLYTYDIHDPSHPVRVDTDATSANLNGVELFGGYLYVPNLAGVDIFDISNLNNPDKIATLPVDNCDDVAYRNGWLFVAQWHGFEAWDVAEPRQPTWIGTYASEEHHFQNISVCGGYVYGGFADRVEIVDFQNPADPHYIGWVESQGIVQQMFEDRNILYIANWFNGLITYDLSDQEHPVQLAVYENAAQGTMVGISRDKAYLNGYRSDMQIVDVSVPASLTRTGTFEEGQSRVAFSEQFAYVATGRYDHALLIAKIEENGMLRTISSAPLPGNPCGVTYENGFVYIVFYGSGFAVVDVRTPEAPSLCGFCPIGSPAKNGVKARYPYAYVIANQSPGCYVVDVSNSDEPFIASGVATDYSPTALLLTNDLLIVGRFRGFDIYSIVDPKLPLLVGRFWHPLYPEVKALAYANNRVYAAPHLVAVDIADPNHPQLVGDNFRATALVEDMVRVDTHLVAAHNDSGLSVFEIHLIPDIDRDGRVDGADLVTLLQHYGAAAGNPDYLPAADFNENGRVDLGDLAKLLSQYGDSIE
jgi:hypothetical protein